MMPVQGPGFRALRRAAVSVLLTIAAAAHAEPFEPPRRASAYTEADEAVYRARFTRLLEDMKVRAGLTSYDPLEIVPGRPHAKPLLPAPKPLLSATARDAATTYAAARSSTALLVMRQGKLELEHYFGTTGRDTPINAQSLAKPVTALLIGRAIQLGHIASLDQPVADFITEWRDDPVRRRILVRHLLDMRSGLLPQGFSPDPADILNRAYLHPRHDEVIINDYPATHAPGSRYEYSNANAELIAPLIERATGRRFAEFLGTALLRPIGAAGGSVWINRPGGTAHSGCCLLLPAQSWLRLGQLLMNDGVWRGRRLLPAGYVAAMRTPTAENPYYGLGTYVAGRYIERRGFANPANPYGKVLHAEPYADRDIFLFDGNGNQVMYMVPSQGLVVLRTGGAPPKTAEWDNAYLPNLLIRDIAARTEAPLPVPQPR